MKARLWKLSMRYIVWAFTHFLPTRVEGVRAYGFHICPENDRWTLHTLAAAPPDHPTADLTFWVRETPDGFVATEVESGVSGAPGQTWREAMDNYSQGVFHHA